MEENKEKQDENIVDVHALIASVMPNIKQRSRLEDIDTDIDGQAIPSNMIFSLKAIHHRILHLTVAGNTTQEIADAVGYTHRMVGIIQSSPAFKRAYERVLEKAEGKTVALAERVQSLKHEALDVLEEQVLRDPTGLSPQEQKLRVDVAKDIIDRSGDIPNVKKHEGLVAHLTADDWNEMKMRASGMIVPGDEHWSAPLDALPEPAEPALPGKDEDGAA